VFRAKVQASITAYKSIDPKSTPPRRTAYRYLLIDSLYSCVIYPAAPQGWVTAGHKTR